MMRTLQGSISIGMVIALLVTACATTTLTSTWKDPSYQGTPRKILVIGLAKKQVNRRIIEDEFVRRLNAMGTNAVASSAVMPDATQGDHAVIAATMREQGADAVLISRLASKNTAPAHVHGSFSVIPSAYGTWRDYYAYGSQVLYTPGYTAEDGFVLVETNLYDARNDKLIWSAASKTEILGSDQDQIKSYIRIMVSTMADQGLVR